MTDREAISYGSVCSGIEAASVAWHPLGWKPSWFAEIEPFPSAVLAHRFPEVPNLGDMTAIAARIRSGDVPAPDVLVGGTPCQAFSVAGMRGGLSDPRGALTIAYVDLANAIDSARLLRGEQPAIIVWENVPGVLSSKDNAFGCFLAGLSGEDCELQPPGGKWSNAGCVFGPTRAVAWRILDAQYFGVAQRRRRVFVVASARSDFDPCSVLFEFDGVRRDIAPSREPEQGVAGGAARSVALRGQEGGGTAELGDKPHVLAGSWWDGGQVRQTLDAVLHKGQTMPEKNRFPAVLQPAIAIQDVSGRDKAQNGKGWSDDGASYTVDAAATQGVAYAFAQNSREEVRVMPYVGALSAQPGMKQTSYIAQPVAFHGTQDPDVSGDVAPPIGRNQGQEVCIAFDILGTPATEVAKTTDVHTPLRARIPGCVENSTRTVVSTAIRVRRITPREGERLQGFPDDWTLVPYRGKPAADGPRYKAIGNSMAVPCMRWIGKRIAEANLD